MAWKTPRERICSSQPEEVPCFDGSKTLALAHAATRGKKRLFVPPIDLISVLPLRLPQDLAGMIVCRMVCNQLAASPKRPVPADLKSKSEVNRAEQAAFTASFQGEAIQPVKLDSESDWAGLLGIEWSDCFDASV